MASRSANSVAKIAARIATVVGPRGMRTIAKFNRFVTNRTQKLWAPYLRHTAVIEHRGRRSGKSYQTPVMAFVEGDSLSVVLNYGEQSDWVRNVMAAGSAQVVNHGKRYTLSHPRVVSNDSAELPVAVQKIGGAARRVLHATISPA